MLVMKFGGSSVANKAQIEKVRGIVASHRDRQPIVVCSAHKGITNALVASAQKAAQGEYAPETVLARQAAIAQELGCNDLLLQALFSEIRDLLRGIHLVKELSPRSLDYISSFGERMSCRCIADYLSRNGVAATAHDVWDLGFITNDNFGKARPLPGFNERVRDCFAACSPETVPIVTGFIGKTTGGEITTVGRNGSDLTASLLAAALGAEEAQIWTDTDGVMTADPSVVKKARNIPHMRFDEAAELAYFGSRVLHPATLLPAMDANIPVRVLNTNRPDHPGTVIQQGSPGNPSAVTSIAYKENQCTLTVSSTRMFGEAGFLARVFNALAQHNVVIDVVTTSEVSVSLTANDERALQLAAEQLANIGSCQIQKGRTILAVVGQHLAHKAGLGSDILQAIAAAGVNVEMISFAAGSINLQMVIADDDVEEAVAVLHKVLFEQSLS